MNNAVGFKGDYRYVHIMMILIFGLFSWGCWYEIGITEGFFLYLALIWGVYVLMLVILLFTKPVKIKDGKIIIKTRWNKEIIDCREVESIKIQKKKSFLSMNRLSIVWCGKERVLSLADVQGFLDQVQMNNYQVDIERDAKNLKATGQITFGNMSFARKVKWVSSMLVLGLLLLSWVLPSHFDASGYVKASLDSFVKNDNKKIISIAGGTEAELQSVYDTDMYALVDSLFGENMPDEIQVNTKYLLDDVYSKAKYTVSDEEKLNEDSYKVLVTVEPMIMFEGFAEEYDEICDEYLETYDESTPIDEVYEILYVKLYDLLEIHSENIAYGDPIEFTVYINKGSDGKFSFDSNDIEEIWRNTLDIQDL